MERRDRRHQLPPAQGSRDAAADAREDDADRREQESDIREGVLDRWERELSERASDLGLLDDDRVASIEAGRERREAARRQRRADAEGRHDAAISRGIDRAGRLEAAAPQDPIGELEARGQRALERLAAIVDADGRLAETLGTVLDVAMDAFAEAAAVTVSLVVEGRPEPAASTAAWATELEAAQLRAGAGPIAEVLETGTVVVSTDLAADDRWDLGRSSAADGDRGVVSAPIIADGGAAGVLTVYTERGARLDRRSVLTAIMVTIQASLAVGLSLERRAHQAQADAWERAVASRDQIGQAKGILMAQHDLTASGAFELLRTTSQALNTKVRDVAEHVVAKRQLPALPAPSGPAPSSTGPGAP